MPNTLAYYKISNLRTKKFYNIEPGGKTNNKFRDFNDTDTKFRISR